uniref:Uncharacterized protein n=1 Tax=Oryza barthii TaxID=65489 RepID=A0A0D3FAZ7_9ORYZ
MRAFQGLVEPPVDMMRTSPANVFMIDILDGLLVGHDVRGRPSNHQPRPPPLQLDRDTMRPSRLVIGGRSAAGQPVGTSPPGAVVYPPHHPWLFD